MQIDVAKFAAGITLDVSGSGQVYTSSNLTGSNTGDLSLAAVGATPSDQGASLSGQVLTLQPADATRPGLLSILEQSIAGAKTWLALAVFSLGLRLGSAQSIGWSSAADGSAASDTTLTRDSAGVLASPGTFKAAGLNITNGTNGATFAPATALLSVSGPAATLAQMPRVHLMFNGDPDAAVGYLTYAHDNLALTFDAYHNGTSWIASHGAAFALYKNLSKLHIGVASGLTKGLPLGGGFTFAWSMDTAGNTVQSGAVEAGLTGFILKSPNGTRWRITVDNAGVLNVAAA